MGTTMVAALFRSGKVGIAHVGDSRMYRLRGPKLEQMTKDHSLYQEVIDKGLCSPQEALEFANKSLVTRALGVKPEVKVDVKQEKCLPGDIYLLCSDGLNDMLGDRDIHLALRRYDADLEQAGKELVALANQRGGKDNISVVLVRILTDTEGIPQRGPDPDGRQRQHRVRQGQQAQAATPTPRPEQQRAASWQN
jgi:protein phosphatase